MAQTKVRQDFQNNWSSGVITNARPDVLPEGSYLGAQNMQMRNLGGGTAILGTRPGLIMHNSTKISAHTVLGQREYRRYASSAFTGYHLAVTAAGKLKVIASNGAVSDADAGAATPFTAGEHYPDFAVANNLIFIVNGKENKKFNGTNVQAVGGADPSAPTVADNGAAGNPDGTYDFAISFYNSATGYETSRSAYNSVTVVTNKIDVSWSAPADAQFDYVRVHIRKGTLSGSFFRMTTGSTPAPNATHGGFAVATTATVVDITDAQINALVNVSPNTTENDPPPVLDRICFHQGRLFGVDPTDPSTLLFSKLTSQEAFDPNNTIPVNVDDGDRITALVSSNESQLLVFKRNAIYALRGTFPDWDIETVSGSVGCTSHMSTLTHDKITYFWSLFGPAATDGVEVQLLAQPNIANTVDKDAVEFDLLNKVAVGFDAQQLRILWSIPPNGGARNKNFLPYSIRIGAFESELWQMIDCASMTNVLDANEVPRLFLGDYNGRLFKLDHATFNDGVATGTRTGTPTAATSTTLTDSGATFFTTGDGLAQLYVVIEDSTGAAQRKRIASNTGTVLTLDTGEAFDPVPDNHFTYYIGTISPVFNFGWKDGNGTPMWKKQLEYLTLDVVPPETEVELIATVTTDITTVDLNLETTISGSEWDSALWDVGVWAGPLPIQHLRRRIGTVGRTFLVTVRSNTVDAPFAVARVGVRSKVLTERG